MDKNKILAFVLYCVGLGVSLVLMFVVLRQVMHEPMTDLVPLLFPFEGFKLVAIWDATIVYIILPFFIILIGMLLDKPMARLMIWLHKIISLKKNDYFIMESVSGLKKSTTGLVSRTIIPAFFSLSVGFLLVGMFPNTYFFNPENVSTMGDYNVNALYTIYEFQAIFFASALFLPVTYLLFSPLWLLEDAGVTFFYKLKKERKAINIQCVSRYYSDSLKGYISVTVLISLAGYIYKAIQVAEALSDNAAFMILFSTIAVPLLLITFLIPASLYHEHNLAKQVPAFQNKLRKGKMPDYSRQELEKYLPE